MSIHDEEAPPVVMPPVTRDPTLGWTPPGPTYAIVGPPPVEQPSRGGRRIATWAIIIAALGEASAVAAGFAAHAVWHAIMLGWRLG